MGRDDGDGDCRGGAGVRHWQDEGIAQLIKYDLSVAPLHYGVERITFPLTDEGQEEGYCVLSRVARAEKKKSGRGKQGKSPPKVLEGPLPAANAHQTKVVVGVNAAWEVDPFQLAGVAEAACAWVCGGGKHLTAEEESLPCMCLLAVCDGPVISYQRVSAGLYLRSEIGLTAARNSIGSELNI